MTVLVAGREEAAGRSGPATAYGGAIQVAVAAACRLFPATAFPPPPLAERPGHLLVRGADDTTCSFCRVRSSRSQKSYSTPTMR